MNERQKNSKVVSEENLKNEGLEDQSKKICQNELPEPEIKLTDDLQNNKTISTGGFLFYHSEAFPISDAWKSLSQHVTSQHLSLHPL